MPSVKDILKIKGSQLYKIGLNASVLDAAVLMNDNRIGALVVVKGDQIRGIFTERDVLHRVVAKQLNPAKLIISTVMTKEVICCHVDTKLLEAQSVFKNRRIRHLPVLDGKDGMVGIISIGDVNAHHAHEQETTIRFLHEYLYGSV